VVLPPGVTPLDVLVDLLLVVDELQVFALEVHEVVETVEQAAAFAGPLGLGDSDVVQALEQVVLGDRIVADDGGATVDRDDLAFAEEDLVVRNEVGVGPGEQVAAVGEWRLVEAGASEQTDDVVLLLEQSR
jgi:hypothetical protein